MLCLHVGSSSSLVGGSSDAPPEVVTALFFVGSIITVTDWLFSKVALRFPGLRIAISEGGVGWVPALMDRVEHCFRYRDFTGGWTDEELHPQRRAPAQLLVLRPRRRGRLRDARPDRRGPRHGRVRLPARGLDLARHPGVHRAQLGFLPEPTIEKLTWRNACELYRFELGERAATGAWQREVPSAS